MIDGLIIFITIFGFAILIITLGNLTDWMHNAGWEYGYLCRENTIGGVILLIILIAIVYGLSFFTATF